MARAIILSASPNSDGLTAACADAARRGLLAAGIESDEVRLTDSSVGVCEQCDNGWGTCRSEHRCKVADGFQAVHERVLAADGLILVTPVYWGEMSESMKAFTDRLRRCEATRKDSTPLRDRPVLGVAAAGGSGGGTVTCTAQMDRLCSHIGARRYDLIGVTRWTREQGIEAIETSSRALGETLKK